MPMPPVTSQPAYRQRSPEVRAVPYAPGLEDGWAVLGAEDWTVAFFHPRQGRAEAWARERGYGADRVVPALYGWGWEGEILPVRPEHWLVTHPNGRQEVVPARRFAELYELMPEPS